MPGGRSGVRICSRRLPGRSILKPRSTGSQGERRLVRHGHNRDKVRWTRFPADSGQKVKVKVKPEQRVRCSWKASLRQDVETAEGAHGGTYREGNWTRLRRERKPGLDLGVREDDRSIDSNTLNPRMWRRYRSDPREGPLPQSSSASRVGGVRAHGCANRYRKAKGPRKNEWRLFSGLALGSAYLLRFVLGGVIAINHAVLVTPIRPTEKGRYPADWLAISVRDTRTCRGPIRGRCGSGQQTARAPSPTAQ